MKKIFMKTLAVVLVLALAVGTFGACQSIEAEASTLSYVGIKINPELELVLDENDKVVNVNAVNEDAEVLLSDLDLVGQSGEEAMDAILYNAEQLGYIGEGKKNEVVLSTASDGAGAEEAINETLGNCVTKYFANKGINGKVSADTLEKYSEQAATWNISTGKTKMVLRALDLNPELSVEELLAMDMRDLVAIVNENMNGLGCVVGNEFHEEMQALKEKYTDMFALCDEVEALEAKLAAFVGDESEKAALTAELTEKQAQLAEMKEAYNAEKAALKENAQAERKALNEQRRAQKQQKIQANGKGGKGQA